MRVATTALLLLSATGTQGFSVAPSSSAVSPSSLFMADAVAEAPVDEETETEQAVQESAPAPEPTGLSMHYVRQTIAKMDASSFASSLETLEPFLLQEAGATFYAKCMKRIMQKAKELELTLPADYAKTAKATEKRRAKQDAFIAVKEEERLAAEAEAAEAAAAEAAAEAAAAAEAEEGESSD